MPCARWCGSAAAELLHDGVTVNALHPTTIATSYVRGKRPSHEMDAWVDPRAMGSLLLWLCSDLGRDVTGASIPMQGRMDHPCMEWHGIVDAAR